MGVALVTVAVVVIVGASAAAAPRLRLPLPLLLVAIGVGLSFVPGFPRLELDPDLVLSGLLPPLLYAAVIKAPLVELCENSLSILVLAVGLVGFTTVGVGLLLPLALPAVPLAAAFALGAVVAPPDAIATTALGRSLGMPRRLTALLEDESLLNDAAALVALNLAIAAVTRPVSADDVVLHVALQFLLAAGGGLVSGVLVGLALTFVRKHVTDPVLDTVLSFAVPYLAFLPAQAVGASGVLAVVTAGLILAQASPRVQSARSRVTETINWRTIQFLLENAVFLLIGLQLLPLLEGVRNVQLGAPAVIGACALVLGAVIVLRFVYLFAILGILRVLRRGDATASGAVVLGWSGMRGVVTLAAAFLLPDVPERPVLQLVAFVVVAGTLVLQGLTLRRVVRAVGLRGPDPAEDALQAAALLDAAAKAGLRRLDELLTGDEPSDIVHSLRTRVEARAKGAWERLGRPDAEFEPPTAMYRRLRMQMLDAERGVVVTARDSGTAEAVVLREALAQLDAEESLLDARTALESRSEEQDELVPGARGPDACDHLRAAPTVIRPNTPGECEDCIREGTTWVHLRTCLTCGHVGCCDSSERRHASRHFADTGHPVMRSAEIGEAWRWCYIDERLG